jgi:hypothetical protein
VINDVHTIVEECLKLGPSIFLWVIHVTNVRTGSGQIRWCRCTLAVGDVLVEASLVLEILVAGRTASELAAFW